MSRVVIQGIPKAGCPGESKGRGCTKHTLVSEGDVKNPLNPPLIALNLILDFHQWNHLRMRIQTSFHGAPFIRIRFFLNTKANLHGIL